MKMKAYTGCARADASIFMVFLLFSKKKIVEEVWTMTKQVVKSKDVKRQTKALLAVFSQVVWEV